MTLRIRFLDLIETGDEISVGCENFILNTIIPAKRVDLLVDAMVSVCGLVNSNPGIVNNTFNYPNSPIG